MFKIILQFIEWIQAISRHFLPPTTMFAPSFLSPLTFAPNFKITDYQ